MKKTNAMARARFDVLRGFSQRYTSNRDDKNKANPYALLNHYAHLLPGEDEKADREIEMRAQDSGYGHGPLTFAEVARADTWFWMHPEKVAGTVEITTSMQFPLTIKGSKEDVIRTIRAGMQNAGTTPDQIRTRMKFKLSLQKQKLKLLAAAAAGEGGPAKTVVTIHARPEGENPVYAVQIGPHQVFIQRIKGNSFDSWYEMKQGRGKHATWDYMHEADRFQMGLAFTKKEAVEALEKRYQQPGAPLAGRGLAGPLAGLGLAGLGVLRDETRANINGSAVAVRAILEKAKQEDQTKPTDKLSFDEVMRLYNPGISENDIKAWVWFRRSIGVPMGGGWKRFYLKNSGTTGALLTTTKATEVLDNAWRVIATVPAGQVIGKPHKKTHEYRGITYRIFTSDDNAIRFVDSANVKESKANFSTSEDDLRALVLAGSLFYVGGELLPYPVFAFGNMYDRELSLQEDQLEITNRYGSAIFDAHVAALKLARPRLLSVLNPDPRERMKILSISEFAREFTVNSVKEDVLPALDKARAELEAEGKQQLEYNLFDLFKMWIKTLPETDFKEVKAESMERYYLDGRPLSKSLGEAEKQTIEMYAGLEAEDLFGRFLYECLHFEDQQKLDFSWNRRYNGQANVPFHRVPVGFECSARFKRGPLAFTPAQREAIAFMETTGSGILAYDVGVGKTMAAIITLANSLYAGKCERPLVVVPNATYKKWVREIIGYNDDKTGEFVPGVLSNVGVTVNEWYNLGANVPEAARLKAGKKVTVPARSITIMTYEGLAKIGLSAKIQAAMFTELSAILSQSGNKPKSARGSEKKQQDYRQLVGGANAGTICDIDEMGFDYLVVDEAHNFKNVFGQVPTDSKGNKRFAISGSESARGQKLFFLANYVQRRYGRNVMLLTATPFTNSPLEIFSMLSLVGYETLCRMHVNNLEVFCETFILQSHEYVNTYDNGIALAPVVKAFNNRLVLQKLIFNHINYKTGEEAGVVRPCKINLPRTTVVRPNGFVERLGPDRQTLTYLGMSDAQHANQSQILEYVQNRDPKDLGAIMRAMGQSLDNALSPHLYKGGMGYSAYGEPESYVDYIEESPKLTYVMQCIATVKKWHEDRKESVSGQIIYMNRGKDHFPLVKEWLHKETGYKTVVDFNGRKYSEVEIISSGLSTDKKEGIKDAFLAGVVKIIIGTATIREGIDLQTKGTVIYNCYPDWNPTDVKQLEGRIWRQGNEFGFVRVVMPLVQDSMDVFVFQKLEEKTSRVNDLFFKGDRGNVLDQESLDPQEVKFALFTDISLLVALEIERQVKDAARRVQVAQADLKAVQTYTVDRQAYLRHQKTIFDVIKDQLITVDRDRWTSNQKRLGAVNPANFDKDVQESLANWKQAATAIVEGSSYDDRDLLDNVRWITRLSLRLGIYTGSFDTTANYFRDALAKVRKAEKTFLKDRNMSLQDDTDVLVETILADLERLKAEQEYYKTDMAYRSKVHLDVMAKKEKLKIIGATTAERVQEFARLNHVLGIKAGSVTDCSIPAGPKELGPRAYKGDDFADYEIVADEPRELAPGRETKQLPPAADNDAATRVRFKFKLKLAGVKLRLLEAAHA